MIARLMILISIMLVLTITVSATSNYPPPPNIRVTDYPELNNEEQVFICPRICGSPNTMESRELETRNT